MAMIGQALNLILSQPQLTLNSIQHVKSHDGVEHTCHLCGRGFDTPDGLAQHISRWAHHCHSCGRGFKTLDGLAQHIARVCNVPPTTNWPCPQCGKQFKLKHHVDKHIIYCLAKSTNYYSIFTHEHFCIVTRKNFFGHSLKISTMKSTDTVQREQFECPENVMTDIHQVWNRICYYLSKASGIVINTYYITYNLIMFPRDYSSTTIRINVFTG